MQTREARGNAIATAYAGGYQGCYLPTDEGVRGRAARFYRDEFRDKAGKQDYLFAGDDRPLAGTETGYIASKDAFTSYARDRDTNHPDWLFKFAQSSGDCVGASGVEMLQGLLGTRAMDPANGEAYKLLAASWTYMFRGSCGQGWYGGAHASRMIEFGYCFADNYVLPDTGAVAYDDEQESETATVNTWCRSQPDDFIALVRKNGWFFEPGAITEFSGGLPELKAVIQAKGQLHHGSNATSSGRPDNVRSIGGHMQTMFGGDWSDAALKWFSDKGVAFTVDNFACCNHQTWGPGAGTDPAWWPTHLWGPQPEGAWIVGAQKQLRYFAEGYVYLPRLKGIPSGTPVPPPPAQEWPEITGELFGDVLPNGQVAIRGVPTVTVASKTQDGDYPFLVEPVPGKPGRFRLTPKLL
jgi:hypothetical protein